MWDHLTSTFSLRTEHGSCLRTTGNPRGSHATAALTHQTRVHVTACSNSPLCLCRDYFLLHAEWVGAQPTKQKTTYSCRGTCSVSYFGERGAVSFWTERAIKSRDSWRLSSQKQKTQSELPFARAKQIALSQTFPQWKKQETKPLTWERGYLFSFVYILFLLKKKQLEGGVGCWRRMFALSTQRTTISLRLQINNVSDNRNPRQACVIIIITTCKFPCLHICNEVSFTDSPPFPSKIHPLTIKHKS